MFNWFGVVIYCLCLISSVSSEKIETSTTASSDFPAIRNAKRATLGIENGRCIGLLCRKGAIVVRAVATSAPSRSDDTRLLQKSSSSISAISGQRIHKIDNFVAVGLTGLSCDCKHVLQYLRDEALSFRTNFGTCIPVSRLIESLSSYLHEFTTSGSTRPLAVSGLLAGTADANTQPVLVKFECDGGYEYYRACSTDTLDTHEDTAVVEAVLMGGVRWADLSVDEALARLRTILDTFQVDEVDEDGAQNIAHGRSIIQAGGESMGDSASTSTSRSRGNRAQRVVEWATAGASLGGAVSLSSISPK